MLIVFIFYTHQYPYDSNELRTVLKNTSLELSSIRMTSSLVLLAASSELNTRLLTGNRIWLFRYVSYSFQCRSGEWRNYKN